jgi:choline dehydrogenase-like flavoprotein
MMSTISGKGHLKKIAVETTTRTNDVSATLLNMMLPAKCRMASEEKMEEIIMMTITGATTNKVIVGMHQVPADKTIDQGFQGHTKCHPRFY